MFSAKPQVGHVHPPGFGPALKFNLDPTMYTIVQDVYRVPEPEPGQDYAQRPRPVRIFSAIYHFQYQASVDAAPNYGQPPAGVPNNGSSMTSAFNGQTLQGSMIMDPTQTSFPMPSTYTIPTSETLRTPTEDQNLFDEPFMLDVNFDFEQLLFDDLIANMDNPDPSVSFDPIFFVLLGVDTDGHMFPTV